MRDFLRLLYFFHVVPPVPRLMVTTFGVTALVSALLIVVHPERAAASLMPVLLLQLFAAASGFSVPARRGHYDLLLTTGKSRMCIAAAHWTMSVMPGVAAWIVLVAAELLTTQGTSRTLLTSGSMAAVTVVSTLPWAMTVSLPRFAGAIGWLALLAIAAVSVPAERTLDVSTRLGAGLSWLEAVLAPLLYPPVLVGESLVGPQSFIAVPSLLAAGGAMVRALLWVDQQDVPLEAAQ